MPKKLVQMTEEAWAAVDQARGDQPRNSWIEEQLWKLKAVREAASELGIEKPNRPADSRGRWER